jgi:Ca2+-binding RTX toxin-like protein
LFSLETEDFMPRRPRRPTRRSTVRRAVPCFEPIEVRRLAAIVPVLGTEAGDSITITPGPVNISVTVNGTTTTFLADQTDGFAIQSFGGNDTIVLLGNLGSVVAWAGDGDDTIAGSEGPDTLSGGAGKDRLFGNFGNDRLNGNGGHDRLFGEAGADRLYGYAGDDLLDGGSSGDRFYGDAGTDVYYGQSGNDKFYCNDGVAEYIYGASGTDLTENDIYDYFISCEGLL